MLATRGNHVPCDLHRWQSILIDVLALSTPAWSGLSAIGGALVGGAIAGGATYKIEGARQAFDRAEKETDRKREDDQRRTVVRGVARVMQARYQGPRRDIHDCAATGDMATIDAVARAIAARQRTNE